MKYSNLIKINGAAPLLVFLFASGCTTVVRENIISDINTGIGASITENQKTQMYELKLGFIRTQFYSIPTGKKVEGDGQTNRADIVPNLVSGIRARSGIEHLFIGMDVSENFAVGDIAVLSPAAVAMYISQARDEKRAAAAAGAITNVVKQK
jgi:hypothetical protein